MSEKFPISLRLLWLTENYFPSRGGMAQSCDRIVHSLRSAGVTVDVAHFSQRAQKWKTESRRNGRDWICPSGNDPSHTMNCLWNILSKEQGAFTHVVAFGGVLPMIAAPVYSAWLGVPLVTLLRGNDFDTAIFTPRRADILREALQKSSRVCVVSCDKAQKIKALFPNIHPLWIPNGIDLAEWEPLPSHNKRAQKWRQEHVAEGRRVLGMFGHIKQKKGGLFFLDTLLESGLADRFHLLFAGELDEEVSNWLSLHQAEIAHSIFPFIDRYDLIPHYTACDMVVIASFYDGLPNVLLEAAGLHIPLLASTAGGMGDVLEDNQQGFLFHPGDAHECRRALQRAATASDKELKLLGKNARVLVESRLSHQAETESYLSVFSEIIQEAKPYSTSEKFADIASTIAGD
jgi:glycogen(starch) synthase